MLRLDLLTLQTINYAIIHTIVINIYTFIYIFHTHHVMLRSVDIMKTR